MDNVTHSLIGYVTGKKASEKAAVETQKVWILTSILGNNFPDIDSFITPFIPGLGNRLGHILHHRGYTHTFLLSIPEGLVCAWLACRILRQKENFNWQLSILGICSIWLHIFADSWNTYGVHPFSPFLNTWFYGDMIYIVEPIFYAVLIPFVILETGSTWLRRFLMLFGALMLVLSWSGFFHHWMIAASISALTYALFFIYKKLKSPSLPIFGLISVLLLFGTASVLAKIEMRTQFPEIREDQLMASPSPGNPFCWWLLLGGLNPAGERRTVSAVWSPFYNLFQASTCSFLQAGPWEQKKAGFVWKSVASSPLPKELDCVGQSVRLFLRFPLYIESTGLWQDARFMGLKRAGFQFEKDEVCPGFLPPWDPPSKLQ